MFAKRTLADVDKSSGGSGQADPYDAPGAASMLANNFEIIREPREKLHRLTDDLSDAAKGLERE